MPLTIGTYEPKQLAALLPSRLDRRDPRRAMIAVLLGAPADARWAPAIYTLGLEDIDGGSVAATREGWRYLAILNGVAAAAEVYDRGGRLVVASVTTGPKVNQAIDTILAAKRLPEVQDLNYELTTFRVPGVLTEAYWLKLDANRDLFLPFLSPDKQLRLGDIYHWGELIEGIRDAANKGLEFFKTDMQGNPPIL